MYLLSRSRKVVNTAFWWTELLVFAQLYSVSVKASCPAPCDSARTSTARITLLMLFVPEIFGLAKLSNPTKADPGHYHLGAMFWNLCKRTGHTVPLACARAVGIHGGHHQSKQALQVAFVGDIRCFISTVHARMEETAQKDWLKVHPSIYYARSFTGWVKTSSWCTWCVRLDHDNTTCPFNAAITQHHRHNPTRRMEPYPTHLRNSDQTCIKYNRYNGDCKFGENCKFRHICSHTPSSWGTAIRHVSSITVIASLVRTASSGTFAALVGVATPNRSARVIAR